MGSGNAAAGGWAAAKRCLPACLPALGVWGFCCFPFCSAAAYTSHSSRGTPSTRTPHPVSCLSGLIESLLTCSAPQVTLLGMSLTSPARWEQLCHVLVLWALGFSVCEGGRKWGCGQMFPKETVVWSRSVLGYQDRHLVTGCSAAQVVGMEVPQWTLMQSPPAFETGVWESGWAALLEVLIPTLPPPSMSD